MCWFWVSVLLDGPGVQCYDGSTGLRCSSVQMHFMFDSIKTGKHILLSELFDWISQTIYCWGSQFSLKRCLPLSRWWCPALPMCPYSFVSQSGWWWCPALWMSVFTCLPSFVSQSGWWCPALWMSVFTCLPSFVSQSGWWCPALWMSFFTCVPSFVSQSGWWCPALWMFVFTCLPSFVS